MSKNQKLYAGWSRICLLLPLPDSIQNKNAHNGRLVSYTTHSVAEKWLNEHYPNWKDHNAYWNEEKKEEEK